MMFLYFLGTWLEGRNIGWCVHGEWNFPHILCFMLQGEHGRWYGHYNRSLFSLWGGPYDCLEHLGYASHEYLGGNFLWITILEGDSFHLDDSMEMGVTHWEWDPLCLSSLLPWRGHWTTIRFPYRPSIFSWWEPFGLSTKGQLAHLGGIIGRHNCCIIFEAVLETIWGGGHKRMRG